MLSKISGVLVAYTYPAYSSFLALKHRDSVAVRRWLLYWTVLGMVRGGEVVADTFLSWLPLYDEAKLTFYIWLVFPGLSVSGFVYLFRSHINPPMTQNRERIDASVDHMLDLGRRTIGVPGTGISRLAMLCRTAGIPLGSSSDDGDGDGDGDAPEDTWKRQ